jgi:hypothetical protein
MNRKLTLLSDMPSHKGSASGNGSITQYQVSGMEPPEQVLVCNFGNEDQDSWRIFRASDRSWKGNYKTAEEVLALLQREIDARNA